MKGGDVNSEIPEVQISEEQKKLNEKLFAASWKGDTETVNDMIRAGASVNAKDKLNRTPLFIACRWGHEDIVKNLINADANVNANFESNKETPLHAACKNQAITIAINIAKALIDNGAKLNANNKEDKETPTLLHIVSSNGNMYLAKFILEKINEKENKLFINAENGKENKLVINAENEYRSTPLHIALENGHTEIAKDLIENGADVNVENNYSDMPLNIACRKGYTDLAMAIVGKMENNKKKENLENTGHKGRTPIQEAFYNDKMEKKEKKELVKFLLDQGVEADAEIKRLVEEEITSPLSDEDASSGGRKKSKSKTKRRKTRRRKTRKH